MYICLRMHINDWLSCIIWFVIKTMPIFNCFCYEPSAWSCSTTTAMRCRCCRQPVSRLGQSFQTKLALRLGKTCNSVRLFQQPRDFLLSKGNPGRHVLKGHSKYSARRLMLFLFRKFESLQVHSLKCWISLQIFFKTHVAIATRNAISPRMMWLQSYANHK